MKTEPLTEILSANEASGFTDRMSQFILTRTVLEFNEGFPFFSIPPKIFRYYLLLYLCLCILKVLSLLQSGK